MNHIAAIWQGYLQARSRHEACILATIVHTQGSTYRKPGARMLITAGGETIGMLSGGCLEQDILAHCEQVFQTREPRIVTYDTSTEEDIRWGFGLGCDGAVKVLLEILSPDRLNPLACLVNAEHQAIATVFATDFAAIPIGARVLLRKDQTVITDVTTAILNRPLAPNTGGTRLKAPSIGGLGASQISQLVSAIVADLKQSTNQTRTYSIGKQEIQVLLEVPQAIRHLTIFGAGRDVLPVVHFAKRLGWHVTVVDCRAQAATIERFSQADTVILARREILADQVDILPSSIVVIMTHNYYDDMAILELTLPIQPKYIGILGSRQRSQKIIAELSPEAHNLAIQLHRPIGLDLGGETPEEIALAIIAEIQAVLHDRQGIFLKHRTEPIHVTANQHV
jgi:xanthine dehydrogenase accessory factor